MDVKVEISLSLDAPIPHRRDGATLFDLVAEKIAESVMVDEVVRERVRKVADDAALGQAALILADLVEHGVRPTNRYGEIAADAKPVTLRELVGAQLERDLKVRPPHQRGSYASDRTLLESFLEDTVRKMVREDFDTALKDARAALLVVLREAAAKLLAEKAAV